MAGYQQLMIWDSEVIPSGDGRAVVIARKPLSRMSIRQAAKTLGCSEWTVQKACRAGKLSHWKPGAIAKRRDGRASNAAIMLDSESVLRYKQSVSARGVY